MTTRDQQAQQTYVQTRRKQEKSYLELRPRNPFRNETIPLTAHSKMEIPNGYQCSPPLYHATGPVQSRPTADVPAQDKLQRYPPPARNTRLRSLKHMELRGHFPTCGLDGITEANNVAAELSICVPRTSAFHFREKFLFADSVDSAHERVGLPSQGDGGQLRGI